MYRQDAMRTVSMDTSTRCTRATHENGSRQLGQTSTSRRHARSLAPCFIALALATSAGCAGGGAEGNNNGAVTSGAGGTAGNAGAGGASGASGVGGASGASGIGGASGASGAGGAAGTSSGVGGAAGDAGGVGGVGGASGGVGGDTGGAGGGGGSDVELAPLTRADGFEDAAPPLLEPLPDAPAGTWTPVEFPDAKCRDGSSLKIFVRYSDASPNYYIYLEGGGVCLDDFFCGINPKNVNESLNAESILAGVTGLGLYPQEPVDDGIFKKDPANPVKDWNAIYVPYCTGDVYAGTKPNATFPPGFEGLAGHTEGTHQFVGFDTASKVLGRIVPTFPDAKKALITGSSAGGMGALLHSHRWADMLTNAGYATRGFVVSDSAMPFDDQYLAKCTQKTWRSLWGLDGAFPQDCAECFNADGGGIATGMAGYLKKKYSDTSQVLGGIISSQDDEIISLFFGSPLPECTPTSYDLGVYNQAINDFRDNIAGRDRFGTYFLPGTLHMHLWRSRFYETNGTSMTIAEWLGKILNNEAVHVEP
jgi:hypothetical protein